MQQEALLCSACSPVLEIGSWRVLQGGSAGGHRCCGGDCSPGTPSAAGQPRKLVRLALTALETPQLELELCTGALATCCKCQLHGRARIHVHSSSGFTTIRTTLRRYCIITDPYTCANACPRVLAHGPHVAEARSLLPYPSFPAPNAELPGASYPCSAMSCTRLLLEMLTRYICTL